MNDFIQTENNKKKKPYLYSLKKMYVNKQL